jgi:UDP-N-acetylmuramyl pentapeptide phosphotransferase/UDP-N-acetylglucosamine-1-phosphate transferase
VVEALWLIIQVVSCNRMKQRILRMVPIRHHFETTGRAEPQVVIRFWIISPTQAIIGLVRLKVRPSNHQAAATARKEPETAGKN